MKCENCQKDKKDHVKVEGHFICPTALFTGPVGSEEEKEPDIAFPSAELATALHRSAKN